MLIPFGKLVREYGLHVRGVLHVGAHMCEEEGAYAAEGVKEVIWLDANHQLVQLQRNRGKNIHHILASDKDGQEVDFHIANNGQSSSMLELGLHKTYHPQVVYTSKVKMTTKRIDTLAKEQKWDMSRYNFVNLDVQGADLLALKGMDSLLHGFDAVYVEVNTDEVYVGCAKLPEMDAFLASHGFTRKEILMTDAKWGDAFYLRTTTAISSQRERILLDIGAHRGMYADAQIGFDKMILVEPAPTLVAFLKDKYRSTTKKVVIIDKMVSDEVRPTFYLCNVDTVSTAATAWMVDSRFADKGFEWTPLTDVPVTTLDAIIQEHGMPTKTKIDVEGYESHVVKSLSKYIGPLSFQWAEEVRDDVVRCIYHLSNKLGYTKFHIQHQDKYDFTPSADQYILLDTLIQQLDLWQPNRKDGWGMIHCL